MESETPVSDAINALTSPREVPSVELSIPSCHLCSDCAPDLILESSDGIRFGAAAKNLHIYSEAFPAPESIQGNSTEIAVLAESSGTLKLMLQYMHRMPQPDLWKIEDITVLLDLGEAVEKYMIFPAMEIVKQRIRSMVPEHPVRIFAYAARQLHMDILAETIHLVVDMDHQTMKAKLAGNPRALLAWFLYREELKVLRQKFIQFQEPRSPQMHKGGYERCDEWDVRFREWKQKTVSCTNLSQVLSLADLWEEIFEGFSCSYCAPPHNMQHKTIYQEIKGYCTKIASFEECMRFR
ncbi:hypothetical protein DL96DRAFT_1581750 [Flagelloscypha sp. PMI_526]|nr:hypothetical protein DL96DRAFT_1581750 [Flagelloscypha sp. PMI_526]